MSKVVKSVKKTVKSAGKEIGRGAESLAKETERGLESTGKMIDRAGDTVLGWAQDIEDALIPPPPDVNIPEQQVAGATPGVVAKGSPNVNLGATEGRRRTSGSAKGSRKLRVPLGGLR